MSNLGKWPRLPNFGGSWSEQKLAVLGKYLKAYTTALKNQPFHLIYIDAFAGRGRQYIDSGSDVGNTSLFCHSTDIDREEQEEYLHGSPLVALENSPPFAEFIFIEKVREEIERLKSQIDAAPHRTKTIHYINEDANDFLPQICRENDWTKCRAVVFIDPFATECKWSTVETLAHTKAVDLWLLFPAMAINRLMSRDGNIPAIWQQKLTTCFGTEQWKRTFYQTGQQKTLFHDTPADRKVEKIFLTLNQFVREQLETIFCGVSKEQLMLKNSRDSPMFLFCFACANPNPRAHGLAVKMAESIISTSQ